MAFLFAVLKINVFKQLLKPATVIINSCGFFTLYLRHLLIILITFTHSFLAFFNVNLFLTKS